MTLRLFLSVTCFALLSACSTTDKLKQPCSDPGILAYTDDCGPLLPVNDAFKDVLVDN